MKSKPSEGWYESCSVARAACDLKAKGEDKVALIFVGADGRLNRRSDSTVQVSSEACPNKRSKEANITESTRARRLFG